MAAYNRLWSRHMPLSAHPAAALRSCIRVYLHVQGCSAESSLIVPVPARSAPVLEFTFGDPLDVIRHDHDRTETAHRIAVIGVQTWCRVTLRVPGCVDNFAVMFQPGGFYDMFGVPGADTLNGHFEASSVIGASINELYSDLAIWRSFEDRVNQANRFFAKLYMSRRLTGVGDSSLQMVASSGCIRIQALADNCGVGIRQFERRFLQQIGVSPRLFSRIVRFEAAVKRRMQSPDVPWTNLAQDLGYFDQMHMVHDFKKLAGRTPGSLLPRMNFYLENPI